MKKVKKKISNDNTHPLVAIIMGSENDKPVMEGAEIILKSFGIQFETQVISAHRIPRKLSEYISNISERGIEVIIAGAGMAAHLPGVIASQTLLPVIGVPIKSGALNGLDALYSIVQMPTGIPVATVAIDGSKNAAYLAAQILGIKHKNIVESLKKDRIQGQKRLETFVKF
jgi:5-(carboxyamino)imidazole ribonucleotide mutase